MDFQIPPGLTEMMQEFTVAALRERPDDIVEFAAEYFVKLSRDSSNKPKGVFFEEPRTGRARSASDSSSGEEPG